LPSVYALGGEIVVLLALLALHHVTRLKFELATENDGETIGAARFLHTGNARAHTPLVHFMSECVSFVLEEAELLGGQQSVSARRVDMCNGGVYDRGFRGSAYL
jgi:hypothetical protein